MFELIKVDYTEVEPTISARELHNFLNVKTYFKDWFPRMCDYGFVPGIDFNPLKNEQVQKEGNREVKRIILDYQLTIPMAKELCMIQRTKKGKMARKYFLEIEKAWNTPEMIMNRALKIAENKIKILQSKNLELMVSNEFMKPKVEYFDELVDRNLLTNFRDTAKEFSVKERKFVKFLIDKNYIFRDQKKRLRPYAAKNNGLFELKETMNGKSGWAGVQTLITPKGREVFRALIRED